MFWRRRRVFLFIRFERREDFWAYGLERSQQLKPKVDAGHSGNLDFSLVCQYFQYFWRGYTHYLGCSILGYIGSSHNSRANLLHGLKLSPASGALRPTSGCSAALQGCTFLLARRSERDIQIHVENSWKLFGIVLCVVLVLKCRATFERWKFVYKWKYQELFSVARHVLPMHTQTFPVYKQCAHFQQMIIQVQRKR